MTEQLFSEAASNYPVISRLYEIFWSYKKLLIHTGMYFYDAVMFESLRTWTYNVVKHKGDSILHICQQSVSVLGLLQYFDSTDSKSY